VSEAESELEELGLNTGHLRDQLGALQHIAIRRIAEILVQAIENNQEENA
jgi:hypothetical protein